MHGFRFFGSTVFFSAKMADDERYFAERNKNHPTWLGGEGNKQNGPILFVTKRRFSELVAVLPWRKRKRRVGRGSIFDFLKV